MDRSRRSIRAAGCLLVAVTFLASAPASAMYCLTVFCQPVGPTVHVLAARHTTPEATVDGNRTSVIVVNAESLNRSPIMIRLAYREANGTVRSQEAWTQGGAPSVKELLYPIGTALVSIVVFHYSCGITSSRYCSVYSAESTQLPA